MTESVPRQALSRMATCGGCAAKVGPGDLRRILAGVAPATPPALLVGNETGDAAAVYRLDDERALVVTTDFITPICDDPYLYGQVAAGNAISDVFAMGGTPLVALAVCAFPEALLPEVAAAICAGGADKAAEAGAVVAGGHTVRNPELLYGLAVTGAVHPARVVRNAGARPGAALVLTKPIGTGMIVNGARGGALDEATLLATCRAMAGLNATAAALMVDHGAQAATDVTGFGLVGHALGMARASGVRLRLSLGALPLYPEALRLAREGIASRGARANRATFAADVRFEDGPLAALAFDPQTSGGLLIALPAGRAEDLCQALRDRGGTAAAIGEALEPAAGDPPLALVP